MTLEGEPIANRGFKLRIYPTEEQKKKMLRNMQASRKAYNYAVAVNLKEYEEWGKVRDSYRTTLEEKKLSKEEIDKEMRKFNKENIKNYVSSYQQLSKKFNNEERKEKEEEWRWLKECDSTSFTYTFGYNFKKGIKSFKNNYEENKKRVDEKRKENDEKEDGKKIVFTYPKDYGFPQFKKYKKAHSYPTIIKVENIDIDNKKVFIPKIGWVKHAPNQKIPAFIYPSKSLGSPYVSTNGRDFFLSFGYYRAFQELKKEKTGVIGVDLGMKNIATLNTGEIIANFADDEKLKKYEKDKIKLQKKLSKLRDKGKSTVFRPYILTKEEKEKIPKNERSEKYAKLAKERYKLSTNQTRRIEKAIKTLQIKINNRRDNLYNEACHKLITEKNPSGIIFENLKIKNMQQNKKWSPKLQKTAMYKFKKTLIWHAKKNRIPCREVSTQFASSQLCSSCGYKNEEMKDLSIRVYKCPKCGMEMDRDKNAGINLQKQWNAKSTKPCSESLEEDKEYIKSISC